MEGDPGRAPGKRGPRPAFPARTVAGRPV